MANSQIVFWTRGDWPGLWASLMGTDCMSHLYCRRLTLVRAAKYLSEAGGQIAGENLQILVSV